ncbi:hypothetical protein MtrunA17_Chr3g0097961 [Medicago truncatula]|uniref:LCR-like protein n=1 Tax=Medicago truncatula TaxID=3880 RepID=G7J1A7_MEDTR|nr:LCR-like protein [Medicago truncatula]RHN67004.1 hypothetical protein MtrunA17_Chr3g0097961 [Medicago truncatula]
MAKHISQHCFLGILCIALVLASGPTPGYSCYYPTFCPSFGYCDLRCRAAGFIRGVCTDIEGSISCCCMK